MARHPVWTLSHGLHSSEWTPALKGRRVKTCTTIMWPTVISCFQVEAIHIIIIITSKREREKGYTSKESRRIFLESKKKSMCVCEYERVYLWKITLTAVSLQLLVSFFLGGEICVQAMNRYERENRAVINDNKPGNGRERYSPLNLKLKHAFIMTLEKSLLECMR